MAEAYFSPGNACRDAILNCINNAVRSIKICVFTISDDTITRAILHRHQMGIDIKIITDNDKCYDVGSDIEQLCSKGIKVKVDKSPYHMHHKFALMDNSILLTGSYNWTRSAADFNHENLVVVKEEKLVKAFEKEFDKLWKVMEEY